ncbi:MAG: exonuclease domain-containing protein [Candidatus Omnitrophica bacterium]|nr:exonuclease domain-containing protein [Candidatus Omnitrophota bacterium]
MTKNLIWPDKTVVFLDLETTGLNSNQDRIIEIGALKTKGRKEVAEFEALVTPGIPIPSFVVRLTGITEAEVSEKGRELQSVLGELREFIGDCPLVGHNLNFDLSFLKAAGLDLPNQTLDTAILTALILPVEKHYSLRVLAQKFFNETEAHRSLSDARQTFKLLWAVIDRAEPGDRLLLENMARLVAGTEPLLSELFREISSANLKGTHSEKKNSKVNEENGWREKAEPEEFTVPLKEEEITRLLDKNGFLTKLANYEHRPQQLEMAKLVCAAFNDSTKLVVEAPTGVGKTLAYLIPALIFATTNRRHVVISTNTRNLQTQVWEKELPFLKEHLPGLKWRASRLLGKENYFCQRRFHNIYENNPSLFPKNETALAYLLSFRHKSAEGILEETSSFMQQRFPDLKNWLDEMKGSAKTCLNRNCSFYRSCFYQKARIAAENSDLIISNHALTLSPPAWFPEFQHLILDEAQNIEDAASESYSRDIESEQVIGILSELSAFLTGEKNRNRASAETRKMIPEIRKLWQQFSNGMVRLLPEYGTININNLKKDNRWPEIELARQNFQISWQELEAQFGKISSDRTGELTDESAERKLVLSGLQLEFTNLREDLAFVFSPQENYVAFARKKDTSWNSQSRQTLTWLARAMPVEVDLFLRERLFANLKTLVCASATLTVSGKFDFFLNRMGLAGLPAVTTAKIDSPFDFSNQSILAIPRNFQRYDYNDHPGIFVSALAEGIKRTALALGGKQLALFSARSRMEDVYGKIKEDLEKTGVAVLCQNIDGYRNFLVETLKGASGNMLLLGSKSFQEGVDISGLKAVLIEKMPFPSRSDPLIEARQNAVRKKGGRPFQDYILPLAIIGLRQSFGRLIRNKSDRGAVIIFDPRILNDYPEVLDSLPECSMIIEDTPAFYRKLADACKQL